MVRCMATNCRMPMSFRRQAYYLRTAAEAGMLFKGYQRAAMNIAANANAAFKQLPEAQKAQWKPVYSQVNGLIDDAMDMRDQIDDFFQKYNDREERNEVFTEGEAMEYEVAFKGFKPALDKSMKKLVAFDKDVCELVNMKPYQGLKWSSSTVVAQMKRFDEDIESRVAQLSLEGEQEGEDELSSSRIESSEINDRSEADDIVKHWDSEGQSQQISSQVRLDLDDIFLAQGEVPEHGSGKKGDNLPSWNVDQREE